MYKEVNILILESMLKSDNYTPLRKYFIWEKLKEMTGDAYGSFNYK